MVLAINVRLFFKPPGTTTPYEVKTTPVHVCVRRYMDVRENATERNARMALTKKINGTCPPSGLQSVHKLRPTDTTRHLDRQRYPLTSGYGTFSSFETARCIPFSRISHPNLISELSTTW